MKKKKFQYIANKQFDFIGKEVVLNGFFKILQNDQYIEVEFNNEKFIISEIMNDGSFRLKGHGYGMINREKLNDVDTEHEEYSIICDYGQGSIVLLRKETFKIGRKR